MTIDQLLDELLEFRRYLYAAHAEIQALHYKLEKEQEVADGCQIQ